MTSGTHPDLQGRVILLVEDEFFIADDLMVTLEGYGAQVVGPVGSLQKAMEFIKTCGPLDAAVLDVNLNGELCFPLAGSLEQRGVPFLFTTGYDEQVIPPDFRHVPRLEKPISIARLAALLSELTSNKAGGSASEPEVAL
jgi:DNA-binding response OmpR family regulator